MDILEQVDQIIKDKLRKDAEARIAELNDAKEKEGNVY